MPHVVNNAYGVQCKAWVVDIPKCATHGHRTYDDSNCFLKGPTLPRGIKQPCRVSGVMAAAATKSANCLMLF